MNATKSAESLAARAKWNRTFSNVFLVAALLFLAVIGVQFYIEVIAPEFGPNHQEKQEMVREFEYERVKAVVLDRLLAPSTAVFCPLAEVTVEEDGHEDALGFTYDLWSGWVDAQNAYGVPVRHEWSVGKNFHAHWSETEGKPVGNVTTDLAYVRSRR